MYRLNLWSRPFAGSSPGGTSTARQEELPLDREGSTCHSGFLLCPVQDDTSAAHRSIFTSEGGSDSSMRLGTENSSRLPHHSVNSSGGRVRVDSPSGYKPGQGPPQPSRHHAAFGTGPFPHFYNQRSAVEAGTVYALQ